MKQNGKCLKELLILYTLEYFLLRLSKEQWFYMYYAIHMPLEEVNCEPRTPSSGREGRRAQGAVVYVLTAAWCHEKAAVCFNESAQDACRDGGAEAADAFSYGR